MSIYRNTGARWKRADGTTVESGAEFVPTDEERLRRAHKLEYLRPGDGDEPTVVVARHELLDVEDYATGNGWYLIGGEKVRGREAAAEKLAELRTAEDA